MLLIVLVSALPSPAVNSKGSSENIAMLCSTARLCSTMPTGNIPEAPELRTLSYNRQKVGFLMVSTMGGSTVVHNWGDLCGVMTL